jgi:hypothetical protein
MERDEVGKHVNGQQGRKNNDGNNEDKGERCGILRQKGRDETTGCNTT